MSQKLTAKFWKRYFNVYDTLNQAIPYQELMGEYLKRLSGINEKTKVLDAGAGTCNLTTKIRAANADVTALDSSPEGLQLCLKKDPKIQTIQHDLTNPLPFPNDYFDYVVSNNTLYLIDQKKRLEVVKEFYRVLKQNGICVIANPHQKFSPLRIYKQHLIKYKSRKGIWRLILHIIRLIIPTLLLFYYNIKIKRSEKDHSDTQFVDTNEQERLLKAAGFKITEPAVSVYASQAYLTVGRK